MSGRTIIEITIPEDNSPCQIKEVYQTSIRLRNIFLDDSGEIYFTTVFNSYNPKPVSNPDEPDSISFYGANSASAVRHDKMQVAFGYIAGYNGFKLYNSNGSKDDWTENKLGVSRLIDEYIEKIEKLLKSEKLYEKFYNEKETEAAYHLKKLKYYRAVFFKNQLFKYNNEHSSYNTIPIKIHKAVRDRISQLQIPCEKILPHLDELLKEYRALISELEKNNRALTYMHGRKISSMEYKPGTDILLITYYNDYISEKDNKHYYHTTVAEFNTTDLSSRVIHTHTGHNKIRTIYSGDDIVIIALDKLWIVTANGEFYTYPVIYNSDTHYFFTEGMDSFYQLTGNAVYEFNKDLSCIRQFSHHYGRNRLSLVFADNTPYLAKENAIDSYLKKINEAVDSEPVGIRMLNLKSGASEQVLKTDKIIPCAKRIPDFYGKTIADRTGNINFYKDGVAEYTFQLQRNLYISGCDFTGITGNLTEPEYVDILNFYGALTDRKPEKISATKKELDFSFSPSCVAFKEPEELKDFMSPYIFSQGEKYLPCKEDDVMPKPCEIWLNIQKSSYRRISFSPADFMILEWVNSLSVLTSDMIYYLINAGLIEYPGSGIPDKNKISHRMNKTLYQNLKILKKFTGPKCNKPIYTINSPYGSALLSDATGAHFKYGPYPCDSGIKTSKLLLLNLWFTYNLMKLKDHVEAYDKDVYLVTEFSLIPELKNIRRYIKFKNSAVISRIIRGKLTEKTISKNRRIISYFCDLASNYPYLLRHGTNENLNSAPSIVIIGQDFEYCKTLNEALKDISPHIRKVYTYDALIHHCIANDSEDMYIEFTDGEAFSVSMHDLL